MTDLKDMRRKALRRELVQTRGALGDMLKGLARAGIKVKHNDDGTFCALVLARIKHEGKESILGAHVHALPIEQLVHEAINLKVQAAAGEVDDRFKEGIEAGSMEEMLEKMKEHLRSQMGDDVEEEDNGFKVSAA